MSNQPPYPPYSQPPGGQYPAFPGAENANGPVQGYKQMGSFSGPYHHHHHPFHPPHNEPAREAPANTGPYPDLPPLDDEDLPHSIIPGLDVQVEGSERRGNTSKSSNARAGHPSVSQLKQPRASATNGKAAPEASSAPAVPAKRKGGGRVSGSANFTDEEITRLLKLVGASLPIGGDGWEALSASFNTWAKSQNRPERDAQSVKNKFDRMVNAAGKKPTGKAQRHPLLETALALSEMIDAKVETEVIGGGADEEDGGDGTEEEDDDDDDEVEIVERPKKIAKVESVSTSKVVKAYQANRPSMEDLQNKPRRANSTTAATQVLSSIGDFFNPSAAQERDGARLMSSFQMMQLTALQNEKRHLEERVDRLRDEHRREIDRLRESHSREVETLRERLYQERSRADRLETPRWSSNRDHRSSSWREDTHHHSSSPYEGDSYPYRQHSSHSSFRSPIPSSSTSTYYSIRSPRPIRSSSPQRSFSSPSPRVAHSTSVFRATISPTKCADGKDAFVVSEVERVDSA